MQQEVNIVLLSIKPEFAKRIFNGTKKYEFRKSIFKQANVRKAIVYASSPVKKVVGEFFIEDILNDNVDAIWKETSQYSGISKPFYQMYFENRTKAYAIKIGQTILYDEPKSLSDFNIKMAPQSFMYLK